jgi:hypothetical protein
LGIAVSTLIKRAATISAGLAIAARPVACMDPIFPAITAHREAAALTDTENTKLVAAGGPDIADWSGMQAAVMAKIAAAKALIGTEPSTTVGVDALERHIRGTRYSSTARYIRRELKYAGRRVIITGGDEGVAWLVAGHRERLSAT